LTRQKKARTFDLSKERKNAAKKLKRFSRERVGKPLVQVAKKTLNNPSMPLASVYLRGPFSR
jgi:hypothetical protein